MALADVSGPPLPVCVQVRQRVDSGYAGAECVMRAREQLWSPARKACPGVQQSYPGLPPVELRVQRRQIGDLQGDSDDADQRGDVKNGLLGPALCPVRP